MPITRAYGCLFCVTGKEGHVVSHICESYPDVRTIVAQREKIRKINGCRKKEKELLLPGYVFFEADDDFQPLNCFRMNGVIRVLAEDQNAWQLQGRDRDFAQWLFEWNGLLETSTAYRENDRIRIAEGPLKDLEGQISKIDRHSRRGRVDVDFHGQTFTVWLSFDIVEPMNRKNGMVDG